MLRTWRADYGVTLLRFAVPLMAVVALVWLGYQFWRLVWGSVPISSSSPVGAVDLILRYDEVHRWFSGRPVYSELVTAVYPPASFVLLWPFLGWLAISPARWLWAIISVASLIWLIYLLIQESGAETPLERAFVALLPLAIYPTGAAIGNGQLIVLLLPLLVAALVLLRRQRGGWREDLLVAALMLITLVKPSQTVPFFWIVLFVPRSWRPVALVSLGYLVLTFFALSFQDASPITLLREWLGRVSGLAMNGGYADLHSLLRTLGLENWSLPASLLMLAVLGVWIYRHRQNDIWLLLGVTALVARSWTYHRWYDDLLILLPMIALFRVAKLAPVDWDRLVAGALFALTLLVMLAPGGLYLLPPPWNMLYVGGQIIVWIIGLIFLLNLTRRERNAQMAQYTTFSWSREMTRQIRNKLLAGGLGLAVLAVVGAMVWQGVRFRGGETVSAMHSPHIATDSDPGQYNSYPPTSGPHYVEELDAGFYETNNYQYAAGYLVHNLEHGYIIFWYNCTILDDADCTELKTQIRSAMDEENNFKVIAYPLDSIDAPVVMTSWERLQKMETFDTAQARAFYNTNLNNAPEPGAP